MRVSLIGTGLLGSSMATRLLQKGHDLVVYNRTQEKVQPLIDQGARHASSIEEAAKECDCMILVLADYAAIKDVLLNHSEVTLKDKTVIQMGTISPKESIECQKKVFAMGGEYFECPVLGSRPEAIEGKLILLAGATQEKFDDWKEFLKVFGPAPQLIGEVGQAAAVKLALNQLIVNHAVGFSLSLNLVQSYGADVEQFMSILRESALYAPMYDKKLPKWLKGNYSDPNFSLKHLLKDACLIESACEDKQLNTAALKAMIELVREGVQNDLKDEDYSSVFEVIKSPL